MLLLSLITGLFILFIIIIIIIIIIILFFILGDIWVGEVLWERLLMDSVLWFTTFLSMMYHFVTVTENANKKKKKKEQSGVNTDYFYKHKQTNCVDVFSPLDQQQHPP